MIVSRFLHSAPATTLVHTLSLHDALPIFYSAIFIGGLIYAYPPVRRRLRPAPLWLYALLGLGPIGIRSEEHTSELQSRENLVCRLLLEKKKIRHGRHPLRKLRFKRSVS